MIGEYRIHANAMDMSVAFDCEAQRAKSEGFNGVYERQSKTALHIRNAETHMINHCPEGYRVQTEIVISYVPNVNAVLRDEYRK